MLASYVGLLMISFVVALLMIRSALLERTGERVNESLVSETTEFRMLVARHPMESPRIEQVFDTYFDHNTPGEGETIAAFVGSQPYRVISGARGGGAVPPAWMRRLPLDPRPTDGEIETASGRLRYRSEPVYTGGSHRGTLVVASALDEEHAQVTGEIWTVAIVLGGVGLLTSVLAWLVAGRMLAPLRSLGRTAQAISETDLDRRIEVRGKDEFADLARTFNAMLDRLQTAFSAQRDFIGYASHELRTPITIVRGHLELLDDDPSERAATIALVTDELERMGRIVNDLLLLAKAESGQGGFLRVERFRLDELTRELFAKAPAIAPRNWCVDAAQPGTVAADRQRLTQAMLNIMHNAAEHTDPTGEIGLGSAIVDGHARLWVRDTGPGIPQCDRERIFERFSRIGHGPRRTEGAGLGLAIARAIAQAHGGRIDLDSEVGSGSTFTIVIPTDHRHQGAAS